MAFRVELSPDVLADIEQAYLYIAHDSAQHAADWLLSLYDVIDSLETSPERCPRAPENQDAASKIRQHFHGRYRILFTISGDVVQVLRLRHGSRRGLHETE